MRFRRCTRVGLCLAVAFAVGPALAQLSSADIAALQARGEQEGWTFTVRENPATQYSIDQLCGVVVPENWRENARFVRFDTLRDPPPAAYDWRDHSGVTDVRDQGGCGSCWAFGLLASYESTILIKDYTAVDLSEQWLVSCCGLGGCSGEWPGEAANFLQCSGAYQDACGGYGAVMEADFPYLASDATCRCPYPHPYCVDSWAFVGPEWGVPSVTELKQALLAQGPLCVCVYVNSSFQGYGGGVFNSCSDQSVNHCVELVGWNDDPGYWIIKNSWGTGWGENGFMRITYGCCQIGYGALFVNYAGAPRTLSFAYPDGTPELLNPNEATTFRVDVGPALGVPVPGTGQLHYALDGGGYTTVDMVEIAPNQYEATLPPATCPEYYDWYVSAIEETEGRLNNPADAPAESYRSTVATAAPHVFADEFELDLGWTVTSSSLTGGMWERGVPAGDGVRGDPAADYDGSGCCYLTGNQAGDSDVDGGPTRLFSPVFDLSDAADYRVRYARWFSNDDLDEDRLKVHISNDDGATWTLVESVAHTEGWVHRSFAVSDYVTPSSAVKVRFLVADNPNNSITEAAVDAFCIVRVDCVFAKGDVDCDGSIDFGDINPFVMALLEPTQYETVYGGSCDRDLADVNDDGEVDFGDINAFVDLLIR